MTRSANQANATKSILKAGVKANKPATQKASRKRTSPDDESNPSEQSNKKVHKTPAAAAATSTRKKKSETTTSGRQASSAAADPARNGDDSKIGKPGDDDVPAIVAGSVPPRGENEGVALVPAVLSFSFQDARHHLVGVDSRFEELFARIRCRPFEELDRVHPFRLDHFDDVVMLFSRSRALICFILIFNKSDMVYGLTTGLWLLQSCMFCFANRYYKRIILPFLLLSSYAP
jgi:hypothetical protein